MVYIFLIFHETLINIFWTLLNLVYKSTGYHGWKNSDPNWQAVSYGINFR
jgi:hypothetical protein